MSGPASIERFPPDNVSTVEETALALKEDKANKNAASGYMGLGADSKASPTNLPAASGAAAGTESIAHFNAVAALGTMATQNANAIAATGGTIKDVVETTTGTSGEAVTLGYAVGTKNVTGTPKLFKASAASGSTPLVCTGIATTTVGAADLAISVQSIGLSPIIPDAAWDSLPAVTDVDKPVYLSKTAGKLCIDVSAFLAADSKQSLGTLAIGGTGACRVQLSIGSPALATASGGTPALTLGTANTAGTASTFLRTDDTILAFDATAPVTQAFGDSAATGSAAAAAHRDHKHGMPAAPTLSSLGAQPETVVVRDAAFNAASVTVNGLSSAKRYQIELQVDDNGATEQIKLQPNSTDAGSFCAYWKSDGSGGVTGEYFAITAIVLGKHSRRATCEVSPRKNGGSAINAFGGPVPPEAVTATPTAVQGTTNVDFTSLRVLVSATSRTGWLTVIEETP